MATDATGTPTSPDNIPTLNVDADAPSGLGFNAAMAAIQAALSARVGAPSGIVSGEVPVWNGTTWVRSSATKIGTGSLTNYPWSNADVAAAAGITYSKLTLTGSVVDADIAAAAAINLNKLNIPSDATKFARGDGTWAIPAGTEIGYDQVTAGVTVTSTLEAGTTVITAAAHTFDGGPVIVEFYCPQAQLTAAAGNYVVVSLFEGATEISRLGSAQNPGTGSGIFIVPISARYRFTPSAGSHTYKITAFTNGANATLAAGSGGASAQPPMFVRFTKV